MGKIVCDTCSLNEAKEKVQEYDYALIYYFSEKYFGTVEALDQINWDECLEAYFFDEKGQMYVHAAETGELTAVIFQEKQNESYEYIDRKYELANMYKWSLGSQVLIREYLAADKDGQTYVEYTRLVDII